MFRRETAGRKIALTIIYLFVLLLVLLMTLPFFNILAVSLSHETPILRGDVRFIPLGFNIKAYEKVFKESQIILALQNTALLTIVGTSINMAMTIFAAYPLSKPWLKGRSVIMSIITFTMLFGAGMIPNYLLISRLKLLNTFWALWLPGAMSTFNLIILKSFFQTLPASLEESAQIDGASQFRILMQITLPLSLASLATLALFYAVGWWNSYFSNLLYIQSSKLITLQIQLRNLIYMRDSNIMAQAADTEDAFRITEEGVKAVSIVIATVPILVVYPFLQKYFVKGVMIGSIKG